MLSGYWCTLEGLNLEKLIRLASQKEIALRRVHRLSATRISVAFSSKDMESLMELAEEWGWKHTPCKPCGVSGWMQALRRRWLLAILCTAAVAAVAVINQWIWQIEVVDAGSYRQDIEAYLEESGCRVPLHRSALTTSSLRDALEWRYPEAAWFECAIRGSTLTIRMMDGVSFERVDADGGCDVVASRDGVITQLITCAGTPVVSPGDVVRKGDLLIRGVERAADQESRTVAARGKVFANVWDSASVRISLISRETIYTGNTRKEQQLRSPWFLLWQNAGNAYTQQDASSHEQPLSSFLIPVWFREITHMEAIYQASRRELETVKAEGFEAARRKLIKLAPPDASFIDIWPNWSIIDDEILLSEAIGCRQVDIALQTRSSGMAAPE